MLMPIIAAVGSFVISERILKPKATALFVLICLAVYDIFLSPPKPNVHNHRSRSTTVNATVTYEQNVNSELDEFWDYDIDYVVEQDDLATSFRCYRGPALLAVAMFCAAFSLRVWRRNGVAVDELIFLPGTPHEFRLETGGEHDIAHVKDSVDRVGNGKTEAGGVEVNRVTESASCFSEGDAAAGAAKPSHREKCGREGNLSVSRSDGALNAEIGNLEERSDEPFEIEQRPLMQEISESNSSPPSPASHWNSEDSPISFIRDKAMKGIDMLVIRNPTLAPPPIPTEDELTSGNSSSPTLASGEIYDAEYAPSAPSVLGAALDLSLPVLFNFHMFVVLMKNHYRKEAVSDEDEEPSDDGGDYGGIKVDVKDNTWMKPPQLPPNVLPLFFITPLMIRSMVPPRQRRRFYQTMLQGTLLSPLKPVRFRDAFVCDCITSMVRPIGDLVYALAYYWTSLFGLFSGKYNLDVAGQKIANSMLMHGVILPGLSVLILLLKFLQTLRQAYDTGKRWPYLGNAFKYLTAGLVILYGITHTAGERSVWWVISFVLATIYQIVWDSCIDWELLVIVPREPFRKQTSSLITNLCRKSRDIWNQIRLRPKRLFEEDSFYWKALFANAALRFCWMAGFIPAYRVSILDGSTQVTFVDKANGWSFVLFATLEIFRRSIWGMIKVELETIKLTGEGENNLTMASTADEYIRNVPYDVLNPEESLSCRQESYRLRCRPSEFDRPKSEEDTTVLSFDSSRNQSPKLEQCEQTEAGSNSGRGKTLAREHKHRWFCMKVSSRFIRWLFLLELLLWASVFLVLSYYVILAD